MGPFAKKMKPKYAISFHVANDTSAKAIVQRYALHFREWPVFVNCVEGMADVAYWQSQFKHVQTSPNQGLDIGGLLRNARHYKLWERFTHVLVVHSKGNLEWVYRALDPLLKHAPTFRQAMVACARCKHPAKTSEPSSYWLQLWGVPTDFWFVAGSMYWIRAYELFRFCQFAQMPLNHFHSHDEGWFRYIYNRPSTQDERNQHKHNGLRAALDWHKDRLPDGLAVRDGMKENALERVVAHICGEYISWV